MKAKRTATLNQMTRTQTPTMRGMQTTRPLPVRITEIKILTTATATRTRTRSNKKKIKTLIIIIKAPPLLFVAALV